MSSASRRINVGSAGAGRLSLAAALCGATLLELIFYRIIQPLTRTDADLLPRVLGRVLQYLAAFSLNLCALLAVGVGSFGVLWALMQGALSAPARAAAAPALLLFLPLCATSVLAPSLLAALRLSPARAYLYLLASFLSLITLLALAVLPRLQGLRQRAALLLLLGPPWIRAAAYFLISAGDRHLQGMALLPSADLACCVGLGLAALLLLPAAALGPRRGPALLLGLLGGAALGGGLRALIGLDWEVASRVLYHGLGLRLPASRIPLALELSGLALWAGATIPLVVSGRAGLRLRGYGLLLLGLAGQQLQQGHQLALWLCGLLCLLRALGDPREPALAQAPSQ